MPNENSGNSSAPQRGALLVTMRPSSPTISAGTNFSISVTINNPFDVPVTIKEVTTLLPVDLFDINQAALERKKKLELEEVNETQASLIEETGVQGVSRLSQLQKLFEQIIHTILSTLAGPFDFLDRVVKPTASALATAVETTRKSQISPDISFQIGIIKQALNEPVEGETHDQKIERIRSAFQSIAAEIEKRNAASVEPITIQPGDSITRVFILRTLRSLMFTPTTYTLDISIKYLVDRVKHSQSIPYTLDIQAGQGSIVTGAVIGSLFGILATEITVFLNGDFIPFLIRAVPTVIISGFAVIAFARKAGVQPIVSIQDFWGGLLIGFLVGYSGTQVLGNLFSGIDTTVLPTPTPTPIP